MPTIIQYNKKAAKGREKLTEDERSILEVLEQDLRETAGKPLERGWASLGTVRQYASNAWHCHLPRNKVAVWLILEEQDGSTRIVLCRFEFVGSRGKAPY